MGRIFISYRRADAEADAGRLYSDLAAEFGAENLFKDVDDLPLGVNVEEHIRAAIRDSSQLLVVVGPNWDAERLYTEVDWVRFEIEAALDLNVPILPIRVRRAEIPPPSAVPESVRPFCRINAAEIEHQSWRRDLRPIVGAIRSTLDQEQTSLGVRSKDLNAVSAASSPDSLAQIDGMTQRIATTIRREVKDVGRFPSESSFAAYCGTAGSPSGSYNGRLAEAIGDLAWSQSTGVGQGRAYFERRLRRGATREQAVNALSRQIARRVFAALRDERIGRQPS